MVSRMTIGSVARRAGIRPSPVRFYERRGLLASERLANGYRVYDREALSALRFIVRAKALGFSLTEIAETGNDTS
jgi:MerR family copper efflux transcriptional regulator